MATSGDHEFELGETLGEGAFGKVFACYDKGDGNKKYAMKVIDLRKSSEDERELAEKEAALLMDLKHDYILHAVSSFQDKGALCIVTEFCDQGDLAQFLERRNGKNLTEPRIVEWFRQICSALKYLHEKNVLHRDMKTQNVFLTGEEMTAKLGDLGLAKVLEKPTAKAVTFCGSPYYMSPEIFACKPYDSKSDIWAMGVCIYEMSTLERPFDATLMQQLVFKIVHGQLPPMPKDKYSKELINVMEKMMCRDSEKRPSAAQLLDDELFQKHKAPTTPPTVPQAKGALGMSTRGNPILLNALNTSSKDKFDMTGLMQTLTEKTNEQKAKKKRREKKPKENDGFSSILASSNISNKFLASAHQDMEKTLTDKTMKKGLPEKGKFAKSTVSASEVTLEDDDEDDDLEGTMKVHMARPPVAPPDPLQMMNLVVRTLTQVFPKASGDDSSEGLLNLPDSSKMEPETMLLHQIEQLQKHCCQVLGYTLFAKAYDLLDQTDDNMKLEEKLIRLLTPEKFAVVGVQLFYCKNFEYNLNKLKEGVGFSKA